ncbi:6-phosphogluconolactonase [Planctomycetaceae bacterium SCGC AG-212-F19]|nr:6-phosphogluconolactonase [Planctomycetaceae bacterium SCGC AG-212-F19]
MRYCFFLAGMLLACAAVHPSATLAADKDKPDKLWVYVGTYTGKVSKGIYRLELDLASGKLSAPQLAGENPSPSFIAIHPSQRFLYAVNEVGSFGGKKTGSVTAFAIDSKTGDLTQLNQQSCGGPGPCHIVVDKEGKNALVANYSGGSCCVVPIGADGKLAEPSSVIQHQGSSVNKGRQAEPHAHSINLDAGNKFAFVADLGLDKILVYRFDPAKGALTANDPPAVAVAPGAGPRHFAFHPDGKHAYVINEMGNTVTVLDYDAEKGVLKAGQSITTLPKDFKGNTSTAEVVVHPSGKFLYGSNRGHDSIAIFAIDAKTGELTAVGHQGTGIKAPRNFAIDPTGAFMLVGNQGAGSIAVFRIDQKTGELAPNGTVEVPSPVCIRFMPAGK